MGKYYVQSGTLRTVVQAESGRKAALWAVHQAMQQILPMGDDPTHETDSAGAVATRQPIVLCGKVRVSERGFDRDDSSTRPTLEVIAEWNEMATTLDRLERMLYRPASEN